MITINLLPEEYRQKRRTPVKFLLATAGAVTVNASLVAYLAWTAFGLAAEVDSELAVLEDTNQGLEPQVAYHKSLEKEKGVLESRVKTLEDVSGKRVSWTRKLDELVEVINRGGDADRYLIWLDDLTVDTKENPRRKSYGSMTGNGHSGSKNFGYVADFFEDIQGSEFAKDFRDPGRPEGTVSATDETLMPAEVFNFKLELDLRSAKERRGGSDKEEDVAEGQQKLAEGESQSAVQQDKQAEGSEPAKSGKEDE